MDIFDDTEGNAGSSASLLSGVDRVESLVAITVHVTPLSVEMKARALSFIPPVLVPAVLGSVLSQ